MIYLILSFNLVFAVLIATYWLLLRDGHTFRTNRYLLLLVPLLSILLPQIPRPIHGLPDPVTRQLTQQIPFTSRPFERSLSPAPVDVQQRARPETSSANGAQGATSRWWIRLTLAQVLLTVYSVGFFIYLGQHLKQWYRLGQTLRRGQIQNCTSYALVRSDQVEEPFSFFRWVVLPQKEIAYTDYHQILEHELIHVRQGHSWDILLGEWLRILCWFNPLTTTYRQLVRNNLEYLVDDTMLRQGTDQRTYQYSLLSVSLGSQAIAMANNYHHSFIKKRITMMNTRKNHHIPFWKGGLIMLQLLGIVQLFGQGLPDISKDMHVVLIGERATEAELVQIQDDLSNLPHSEAVFGVSDLEYDKTGRITRIQASLKTKMISGGLSYNADQDLMQSGFIPLFFGLRQDKTMSMQKLDLEILDGLIEKYDQLNFHTAGLDASPDGLKKMRPRIAQFTQLRDAYLEYREKTAGQAISASTAFQVPEDPAQHEDVRKAVDNLVKSRVQKDPDVEVIYTLDGLKREINWTDYPMAKLAKIEVSWKGKIILRDDQKKEVIDYIRIDLTRRRPQAGQ